MVDFDSGREERLHTVLNNGGLASGGLTVRDYFAAKAMQALIGKEIDSFVDEERGFISDDPNDFDDEYELIPYRYSTLFAQDVYAVAEAMMRERDKKPQTACSVEEAFGL